MTKTSVGLEGQGEAAGSRDRNRAVHLKDWDDIGGSEDKRKAGGKEESRGVEGMEAQPEAQDNEE